MNLQAPIGCLHPDPAMLAIDRALHDDLLDSDLHREIAADAKTNYFARLEVLSAHCDPDVDNRAETFHYYFCAHVLSLCFRLYF